MKEHDDSISLEEERGHTPNNEITTNNYSEINTNINVPTREVITETSDNQNINTNVIQTQIKGITDDKEKATLIEKLERNRKNCITTSDKKNNLLTTEISKKHDSAVMQAVKRAKSNLYDLLILSKDINETRQLANKVESLYLDAIQACDAYIKDKEDSWWYYDDNR